MGVLYGSNLEIKRGRLLFRASRSSSQRSVPERNRAMKEPSTMYMKYMIRPTVYHRRAFRLNLEKAISVVKTSIEPWNCESLQLALPRREFICMCECKIFKSCTGYFWGKCSCSKSRVREIPSTYFHWNRPQMKSIMKPGMSSCLEDKTEVLDLRVPIP